MRSAPDGCAPGTMRHPLRAGTPNTMSSGRTGTRFSSRPVAARIAATIAGMLEIVGGSPTPFAPYGAIRMRVLDEVGHHRGHVERRRQEGSR